MSFITLCRCFPLSITTELKLFPLQKSNPHFKAYSQKPQLSFINLDTIPFHNPNSFLLISLFNDVDISFKNIPVLLVRLHPVGRNQLLQPIEHIPIHLAVKVRNNGSLAISSLNHSTDCTSKLFQISVGICAYIKLDDFIVRTKPWNFQKYIYLLPSTEIVNINTLWIHDLNSFYRGFLQDVIGIVVSWAEQQNPSWTLGWAYKTKETDQHRIFEQVILFVLNIEILEMQTQVVRVLPPSVRFSDLTYNWTKMVVPFLNSLSLKDIQYQFDEQLKQTINKSSLRIFKEFTFPINNCSDGLLSSDFPNEYSINDILMCLKSKVLYEYVVGLNFNLTVQSSYDIEHVTLSRFAGYDTESNWFVVSHLPTQSKYIACGDKQLKSTKYSNIYLASFEFETWKAIFVIFLIVLPIQICL